MTRIPSAGVFRTSQSFTLLTADHLLNKLRWDLRQLEELRWNEDMGADWRQVVSYKAVEYATSIWHLAEWFAEDIRAAEPQERTRQFLRLEMHDPWIPITMPELRAAALEHCPDLEFCRVVAIASKHYGVNRHPRPDIRTEAYVSFARRGDESFLRPVMWLAVCEENVKRDMREIFLNCLRFWEALNYVARPGSPWQAGHPIPNEAYLALEPLQRPTAKQNQASMLRGQWSKLAKFFKP